MNSQRSDVMEKEKAGNAGNTSDRSGKHDEGDSQNQKGKIESAWDRSKEMANKGHSNPAGNLDKNKESDNRMGGNEQKDPARNRPAQNQPR